MKITPIDLTKIENAYEASQKAGENRAAGNGETGLPRDRVCLSVESEKHGESDVVKTGAAREAEQNTSPEKLRQIKAAIESGSYQVSGEDIADAMIGKR